MRLRKRPRRTRWLNFPWHKKELVGTKMLPKVRGVAWNTVKIRGYFGERV